MDNRDLDLLIHDLRGLLTTIESWTGLARMQSERGMLPEEALAGLLEACRSGKALLEGHASGHQAVSPPANLTTFFATLEQTLANDFREKGVRLEIVQPAELTHVAASRGDLTVVLLNLLRNALDVCARGDRVRVRATSRTSTDKEVRIEVEDSGPGLDESSETNIFEFGVSRHGAGRGLGLHAARRAAERAGGKLSVTEGSLGGACFVLSLAHASSNESLSQSEVNAQKVKQPNAHRGCILIVEDDIATRRFMQAALEHDGHTVLQAGSLQLARPHLVHAHVLVVDDRLPDGNGPDLRHETSAPMIVVSGNPALGHDLTLPILRKPFDVQRLCAAVRTALETTQPAKS